LETNKEKPMIEFNLTNLRCSVKGDLKTLNYLYKEMGVRHPNAWFLRNHMPKGWDGQIHYLTETGTFQGGMLEKLYALAKEKGEKIRIVDNRDFTGIKITKVESLKGVIPRPYQQECVNSIINNKVGNYWWPRGIWKEATNAGKTIILALLYKRLGSPKTILIINSTELYEQAMKELADLIDKSEIGYITPKEIKWGNFMICKVATMSKRVSNYAVAAKLESYKVCIVDECDLSDNKTYKTILRKLVGTPVKVGMSGTVYVSKLAKDKIKNENIRSFFGNQIHEITNRELIDLGHSSEVEATFFQGNVKVSEPGDFALEYEKAITKSKSRNTKVIDRVKANLKMKRYPLLVSCKYHPHVRILYRRLQEELGEEYKIDWVHHARPDRHKVVDDFKDGKIDILIGSGILKRGKNFKLMTTLINAGAGLGIENTVQILGRVFRSGRGNKKYYEDFYDLGFYLRRHSKRRLAAVKNEKIKVIENYK
jgi:superfamily II DNA or RNA helicase